jgi:hypothetical protein
MLTHHRSAHACQMSYAWSRSCRNALIGEALISVSHGARVQRRSCAPVAAAMRSGSSVDLPPERSVQVPKRCLTEAPWAPGGRPPSPGEVRRVPLRARLAPDQVGRVVALHDVQQRDHLARLREYSVRHCLLPSWGGLTGRTYQPGAIRQVPLLCVTRGCHLRLPPGGARSGMLFRSKSFRLQASRIAPIRTGIRTGQLAPRREQRGWVRSSGSRDRKVEGDARDGEPAGPARTVRDLARRRSSDG